MCSTLNTIELPEMDYLASNLSPEECFQLYNLLDHRHEKRVRFDLYLIFFSQDNELLSFRKTKFNLLLTNIKV